MKRREFITLAAVATGISPLLKACATPRVIGEQEVGASAETGHRVRNANLPEASENRETQVLIIGAGVSGLSAARHLRRKGITDFIIIDLEKKSGGNATSGKNQYSAFPWGAHYVPLPNNNLTEYLTFLEECGSITGWEKDLPVYEEMHLCADPQERLFFNGRWQDGLVPNFGLSKNEQQQIKAFLSQMDHYRQLKGTDGADAFAIPVHQSSTDATLRLLDNITMKEWLNQQGWNSPALHEYVNYCCRDDFGTPHSLVSAWAGIHYFACRKGTAANAIYSDVLTWPEANGFLIKHLEKNIQTKLQLNTVALNIKQNENSAKVLCYNVVTHKAINIKAQQCIVAVPQFVAARLLKNDSRIATTATHFHYAPWMVANILTEKPEERPGTGPSWDNVIHGSSALGYVDACHQLPGNPLIRNFTYYKPLTDDKPANERKKAQTKTHENWCEEIVNDLSKIHPGIRENIREINIMIWGHAMIQPLPGFIHGELLAAAAQSEGSNIHFAHSDLSGISIFEEAFYQGLNAAEKVIAAIA